jgi:hypothetical protein
MKRAAEATGVRPVLAPDRRESFDMRRPLLWMGGAMPPIARQLPAPPQHEWLEAVRYWNAGGREPVWFLVDPRRTAIDLVQHASPFDTDGLCRTQSSSVASGRTTSTGTPWTDPSGTSEKAGR